MKRINLILIVFILSTKITFSQDSKTIDSLKSLFDSKQYEKLLDLTQQKLKTDSINYDALYYSAQSLFELGYSQDAYYQFSKAISIYPDSIALYNNRGGLLLSVREFQAARKDYNEELRLARNDEEKRSAFVNIAAVHLSVREFQKATQYLEQAYQLDSSDIAVLINLGNAYSDLGMKRKAIEYLEKAIKIDSSFLPSTANLGFIYLELEKYDKALFYFDLVLIKDQNDSFTLNNRGFVKFKLGNYKTALEDINKSIELDPSNSFAFKNRALIYLELKKTKDACNDLQLALNKDFLIMYGEEVNQLIEQHCK